VILIHKASLLRLGSAEVYYPPEQTRVVDDEFLDKMMVLSATHG